MHHLCGQHGHTWLANRWPRRNQQETETAGFVHPPRLSPCFCLRIPVTGCELTGGHGLTGSQQPETGHRARPPVRQAATGSPATGGARPPDPGHRRSSASGPATGGDRRPNRRPDRPRLPTGSTGKPNPAIPLGVCRPALPHVRPRSRKPETSVSGVAWRPLVLLGALENMGVWLVFGLRCVRSMRTFWGEKA